ncbi:ferrochelatase [Ferrovibrio sp.]|uniref:ferrochelatase n=1 Tax=Ferrovibrio sp. TaxID=1917215 RepID=UPI0026103C11|nr:ferrochelatase [Ferrovibrio sp.]
MPQKTAIILFNLGGPDSQSAVEPFLFNLFNDPAIIRLPNPFRWLLAKLISSRRAPKAAEIYAQMGGRSPILPETQAQAAALKTALGSDDYAVFIAMRYWHPFASDAAKAAKEWGAERVILLPLYPQFSTTTTGSSLKDWQDAAEQAGLNVPTAAIGCYPDEPGFVAAQTMLLQAALLRAEDMGKPRILFSAHGLPKKVVNDGDPYQMQVEKTVAAIQRRLQRPDLETQICYQSRVGPLEWIGPATDAEIERAAKAGRAVVVVPVAFVSEHSETLVELDIEYAELARHNGAAGYVRVSTVGVQPDFIAGLARLVRGAVARQDVFDGAPRCGSGERSCGNAWRHCACKG